ncbi:MAG: sensor histidine kinase [Roseivirga sp.]
MNALLTLIIIVLVFMYQRRLALTSGSYRIRKNIPHSEILRATIKGQEIERNRIGRELHDGVGVLLSTTRLYLRHWQEEGSSGKQVTGQRVDKLLKEIIESVRRLSADLRPVVLENLGLAEAIAELMWDVEQAGALKIQFNNTYDHCLPQKDELNIYRVIQELLTNTLRHAEATEAILEMNSQPNHFWLSYRDNGKGLPYGISRKGLGLKNMESRISTLNGQFTIGNLEEGGVLVTIEIERK